MPFDFSHPDIFAHRHIGPTPEETKEMLKVLKQPDLDTFINNVVPEIIRTQSQLQLEQARSESEIFDELRSLAKENRVYKSFIGMGYHDTITPSVIQRNILENPGWYTQYTPYQAEISQGRLEALLNFQTMVIDLTGLEIANASLLDEATAAAEAMAMFYNIKKQPDEAVFFVSKACHPQTIGVIQTRAKPLGIKIVVSHHQKFKFSDDVFGALLQYPTTDGGVLDYSSFCKEAHHNGALVAVAADLFSLTLLVPPGEIGADAAIGNTQRFGVPMGYGGPHAAYFATKEIYKRHVPGRLIGLSVDSSCKPALRMALQTREQHIRREKATSNICTAQVLLAVMAGMYAVYHGPQGLKKIAERIHNLTKILAKGLKKSGYSLIHNDYFDTLYIQVGERRMLDVLAIAEGRQVNLRYYHNHSLSISLDETSNEQTVELLLDIFATQQTQNMTVQELSQSETAGYHGLMRRNTPFLQHPVFNKYHSETDMQRYIRLLEQKDLSLTHSMIPLGSCTMKLNAATEMMPITWPEFGKLHPFAPIEQAQGYHKIFKQLENWLAEMTGFAAISLQPNAGAQGEYTGLLVISAYHYYNGDEKRDICLIPSSAHGTNPSSAVMAGMRVIIVRCDDRGNIDIKDLRAKAEEYSDYLAAFMVTYPSTHGVFEEGIKEICSIVHENGGQVYMDGANLNAQLGLCRPAEFGADVCHLNLHKTFCIPHGGGGPGMGPIGVAKHLTPFLPQHPILPNKKEQGIGPVSAAPWGSSNILIISWAYIAMMGAKGLTDATKYAMLNANYMAKRLEAYYPVLYKGTKGYVAHEFIIDIRNFKKDSGVDAEDIAKRLIDYGFHAPTVSFPVPGTLMIEPTESESQAELDRFCEAMIAIKVEIDDIKNGKQDLQNNTLKNSPHTMEVVVSDKWKFPYSREKAAFPASWTRERKFWPAVGRINNVQGDRHLICACPPVADYDENG